MTIKDLLSQAIDKKISYPEAKTKLKDMHLPHEEYESYDIMLYKLLGKEEKVVHQPIYAMKAIPNEIYFNVLEDSINKVRDEWYTPDICSYLFDEYKLDPNLMNYFVNESISIVRMNSLKPEEVIKIGQAYLKAAQLVAKDQEKSPKRKRKMKIGVETPNINAEEVSEIIIEPVNDFE
jgi:hypothetical protein